MPGSKKHSNKYSNDKLYLMAVVAISRQRIEKNRTKVYTYVKHSMLMFISISISINNSSYNYIGQKIYH